MNIPMPAPTPRVTSSGLTGRQTAEMFVGVRVSGLRELTDKLREFTSILQSDSVLNKATTKGAEILRDYYKFLAELHMATGNLAASTKIKKKKYQNDIFIAVVGPEQTGSRGNDEDMRSGNHAWMVEYGTGPRRPGTQNRRAYVSVHKMVNRRMTARAPNKWDDESFAKAGAGYYFLMGSLYKRASQPAGRPGYSRDFADKRVKDQRGGEGQHPITLKPGDTLAAMPALGLMTSTIERNRGKVDAAVQSVLRAAIARFAA
jgi:hypothetical protein